MNKFFSLAKVIYKCNQGNYALNKKRKESPLNQAAGTGAKIIGYIFLGICGLIFGVIMGVMGYALAPEIQRAQASAEALSAVFILVQAFLLIMVIPMIMSLFFLSTDIDSYIHMPIKPSSIIGAKLITVLPVAYIVSAVTVLPVAFGAVAGLHLGVLHYVLAFFAFVTLPVLPVIYAAVLSIILMHLCKNVKKKDTIVTVITYGIALVAVAGSLIINMSTRNLSDTNDIDMAMSIASFASAISWASWIFPTNFFSAGAVTDGNILYMLAALCIAAAAILIFLWIAERFYIGSALGMNENGRQSGRRKGIGKKDFYTRSQAKSFAAKERKMIFRSPVYLINCFLWPLLIPIIMIVSSAISITDSGESIEFFISGALAEESMHFMVFAPLICVFPAVLVAMMSKVTSTCISREGTSFFMMKSLPISYKKQLAVKSGFGLRVSLVLSFPFAVLLAFFFVFYGGLNWLVLPFTLLLVFFVVLLINDFQLFFEVRNPKLFWQSEEMVVREMRGRIGGLIGLAVLGVLAVLGAVSAFLFHLPDLAVLLILTLLIAVPAVIFHRFVVVFGQKNLMSFEP